MRCKLCNGGKKIIGMGCMEQSCPECDGKGIQPEQKEVTKEIEIVKPPYKRPSRAKIKPIDDDKYELVTADMKPEQEVQLQQQVIGLQSRIKSAEPLQVVVQNANTNTSAT